MKMKTAGQFRHGFGKMIKGVHSFLLKDDELSDTQNMQPGFFWQQRKGLTTLTSDAVASGLRFKSITQFTTLDDSTDVLLSHAYDSSNGERILYGSALPTSSITWSSLYTLTASCEMTQFAQVGKALLAANNKEFLIWRGNTYMPHGAWYYDATNTSYINYFEELTDGKSSTSMSVNSMPPEDYLYTIAPMSLESVIATSGNANSTSSWLIGEYWNGVWTILKQASWWSNDTYMDEDCDDLTGWTDNDAGSGASTQVEFYGRECFKFDSGDTPGGGVKAMRTKDAGTFSDSVTVSILAYHDNIGAQADTDYFALNVEESGVRLNAVFCSDGLFIYDGASLNEVGTDVVDEDEWVLWTFVCDFSTPATATCDVYKNGTLLEADVDCSDTGAYTDGEVNLIQFGVTTADQITYIAQVVVGGALDTTGHGFSDGTASGGATLAQSGSVTWTDPGDAEKKLVEGIPGYAYRFSPSVTLDASVSLTHLDVKSPMGEVKDQWDGMPLPCLGCKIYDGTSYDDFTAYVNNDVFSQHAALDGATTSYKFYAGFAEEVQGLILSVYPDEANANNVSISNVKYHSTTGAATALSDVVDGTETGSASLSQNGTVMWTAPARYSEKPKKLAGDLIPLYWYEITFDATLSNPTSVYRVQGIPVGQDPDPCYGCFEYKTRAWQLAPWNDENAVRYSAFNLPNVWNGNDSGYVHFGNRPLRRALPFYNEEVIWADREMWMLQGNAPANFGKLKLSSFIGISAPMSAIPIEIGVQVGEHKRIVLAWMFWDGIYMFDGVKWFKISSPDIDNFFDPDHDDFINKDYMDQCYGVWDYTTQCAVWLVYTGSSTTPNKAIALHPATMQYGIYDYGVDISSLYMAYNDGLYLVGGGHACGKFYRLNYGITDLNASGTAVAVDAYVITRDMFTSYSEGLKQRLLSLVGDSTAGGLIEVDEYPDSSDTEQAAGKGFMQKLGKKISAWQWRLKLWTGQKATRFRFRNRSKNARMTLFGYDVDIDEGRSEE